MACNYQAFPLFFQLVFSRGWDSLMKMEKKWITLPNSGIFGDRNNNFEQFPFFSSYYYFIEIYVTALDEYYFRSWKGWVESSIIFS